MEVGNEMKQEHLESLKNEISEFRTEVLGDDKIKEQIKELIVDEVKLAKQIAEDKRLEQLELGVGDILPKIDDILQKLWDWWKERKKKVD